MDPNVINNQQEGVEIPQDGNFKMPSLEELLKALENMEGMSEENKQELRENLIARANEANSGFIPNSRVGMGTDLTVLFGLIAVVVLIFGKKIYLFEDFYQIALSLNHLMQL